MNTTANTISYSCEQFGCYEVYQIGNEDNTIFVQTDWDRPGLASSFGWSPAECQPCAYDDSDAAPVVCKHEHTDGTIGCPDCGMSATAFIESATDWLDSHEGDTAEDPGYFQG